MRTLCATHVFSEVAENRFANSRISAALVNNDDLRAYVRLLYVYGHVYTRTANKYSDKRASNLHVYRVPPSISPTIYLGITAPESLRYGYNICIRWRPAM